MWGKGLAFLIGAATGVAGCLFLKSDFGKECVSNLADKCRPITKEGKEWVDAKIKKVTGKFPSNNEEASFSYSYTSESTAGVEE